MSERERTVTRRQVLGAVGTTGAVLTAGCEGSERGNETAPAGADEAADTAAASPTATTPSPTPVHASYETTVVRVETPGGSELGRVTAAIADTPSLRFTGLSETDSLPADRGMLFVFESVGEHTFVMREMDFGLDIVFADADGTITTIHHAPAPGPNENGAEQRYPGRGQYVLEVNRDWTTDHGVETGDRLVFSL